MKLAIVLPASAVLLMLVGCSPAPGPAAEVRTISGLEPIGAAKEGRGVVEGSVLKGPTSPMVQPGISSSANGVPGAQVDFATLGGRRVASVKTDSAGNFRVELPAGTYNITMPSLYGAMFTKDLPAVVTIVAGQVQRLDIVLDTGIR